MKILVTGATGFVGSAVARLLITSGHDVRVLIRKTSDRANITGLPVEPVEGDLADRDALDRACHGQQGLFHVAADYRIWTPDAAAMVETNRRGTENIMRAALAAELDKIVYTSSVATLGYLPDGSPADEETPVSLDDMIGAYKRSKFLAESDVLKMIREDGLPAVIVNPSAPIGPRDIKPTPTGRLVVQAAKGKMPAFVDTGLNIVHVDDVAAGHLLAFEKGEIGRKYILGGENHSLKSILGIIARLSDRPAPRIELPANLLFPAAYVTEWSARLFRMKEPMLTVDGLRMSKKRMYFSSERAVSELGYAHRPVEQAFQDALSWFQAKGYLNGNYRPA